MASTYETMNRKYEQFAKMSINGSPFLLPRLRAIGECLDYVNEMRGERSIVGPVMIQKALDRAEELVMEIEDQMIDWNNA